MAFPRLTRGAGEERAEEDLVSGGYEGVALALMRALARDIPARLILNVANRGSIPSLPDDAIIETTCAVTALGVRPIGHTDLAGHMLGLVQQVKEVDRLVIEAASTGSAQVAVQAFALHPLVDSVSSARALLAGYRTAIPAVDAVFGAGT